MNGERDSDRPGVINWTITPAKWGAVGALALIGCMGLAWSVIRGESRNASREAHQATAAAPESPRQFAGVPGLESRVDPAVEPDAGPTGGAPPPAAESEIAPMQLAEHEPPPAVSADAAPAAMPVPQGIPAEPPAPAHEPPASPPDPSIAQRVNINTATEAQLQVLPGIGPSRARAIAEDRRLNGPFRSVDELDRVRGIGPGIIEGLREFASVR